MLSHLRIAALAACASLAGCANSVADLGNKQAARVFEGPRSAEETANCLVAELNGSNQLLRMSADHFVVTRPNTYGVPVVRWDIFNIPTGSRVELRATFGLGEGEPKARACAGL